MTFIDTIYQLLLQMSMKVLLEVLQVFSRCDRYYVFPITFLNKRPLHVRRYHEANILGKKSELLLLLLVA